MKKIEKYKYYILSFLIPFFVLIVYVKITHASFDDLIISDAREQYIYLFDYLKRIFQGDDSIFYSFNKILGGSFFSIFCYYLASPLNLIVFLSSYENIHIFMAVLMLIKIALCGFTMYFYLSKSNNNNKLINLLFSLSYAFMSYNLIYFFQIMWLDIVFLSPVVIYGLDQILKNQKSRVYIFFLFISIISNYYISYMLCFFCVIYFLFRLITKYDLKEDKAIIKQIVLKFIVHSLLAGFLASFMIIPLIDEMKNSIANYHDFSNSVYKNIFYVFSQLNVVNISNEELYITPYIFCGYFVLSNLINYLFFQKDKNKKVYISFLIFLILGFTNTFLLKLWHGFRFPVLFFHRWSFLFSLFIIIIASERYSTNVILTKKQQFLIVLGYSILIIISSVLTNTHHNVIYYIGIFFLFENLWLLNCIKKYQNNFYFYCMFIVLIFEIFFSCRCNFLLSNLMTKENKYEIQDREEVIHYFNNLDSSFYRVGMSNPVNSVNELFLKKGSLSSFISGNNKYLNEFLKKSGYVTYTNEIYDNQSLEIMNVLLGIKYWYGKTNDQNYDLVDNVKFGDKEVQIYKANNFLQLGYLIENNYVKIDTTNPFLYQNSFFETLFGEKLYKEYEYEQIENKYYINNNYKDIYFYTTDSICKNKNFEVKLTVKLNNNSIIQNYCSEFGIKKFNTKNLKNSIIELSEKSNKNEIYFYYVDDEKYKKMLSNFQNNQIENVFIKGNSLKFKINSSEDSTLLLTIPYEEGWNIFVDGKKVKPKKIFNTFVGIELSNGYHEIKMVYYPKFLGLGFLISIVDLILIIKYCKKMSTKINII